MSGADAWAPWQSGQELCRTNDAPVRKALYHAGLAIFRMEDDALRMALALTGLGALANHRQRYHQATSLLEEALDLAARLEEPA
ncbi:MAG TPA: hypothetical protein VFX03_02845 [Thermomicrobiales bacterium]|nr:hypothetical protein [Thermomicrobiales bacterium]